MDTAERNTRSTGTENKWHTTHMIYTTNIHTSAKHTENSITSIPEAIQWTHLDDADDSIPDAGDNDSDGTTYITDKDIDNRTTSGTVITKILCDAPSNENNKEITPRRYNKSNITEDKNTEEIKQHRHK